MDFTVLPQGTVSATMRAMPLKGHAASASSHAYEVAKATLHGDAVAFWWSAGFFGVGALLTFALLESGVPELEGDLVPLL